MATSGTRIVGNFLQLGGRSINCNTADLSKAIVYLILSYYAFDVSYPRIYSNFLGFLKFFIVGDDSYSFECSQSFRVFRENFKAFSG